ncbi:hypothetical protein [Methylopila sp. M107]|uniref:hypothetical protein n=1 Tax=Methylopila sp. M107 TaxID=1101190 RepID=UPI0003636C42|nr:hypothetical protein [Methylopila sp. M107]
MIELYDVWKGHKKAALGKPALSGASVVIPAGHRVGLLGAIPANNNIVLRVLSGVDEPDKGVVRRVGVPCWPMDYSGFSDNNGTVSQNASFLGRVYGVDPDEITRIAATLSGVRPIRGKLLKQYLGPERRALELGLTLALQFDWYFVDEKLPRLPDATADAAHAAIIDRVERGSLVWASTKPELLTGFCDAGLVLDQGLLTFYDNFDEAAEVYTYLITAQDKAQDDGQLSERKRERRAARRARENGAEEPV